MNKFLDDISEYKVVDRLKEKLQESENLKLEIEAILIKRVSKKIFKRKVQKKNFLSSLSSSKECPFVGINGRVGSIREEN
jgi:hypothetical protein